MSITSTSDVTLAENRIAAAVTLSGAANLTMRNNHMQSLVIATASQGRIAYNAIDGGSVGLQISAPFAGLIDDNSIAGASQVAPCSPRTSGQRAHKLLAPLSSPGHPLHSFRPLAVFP